MQSLLLLCAVVALATADVGSLTEADQNEILSLHNTYRAAQNAVNMPNLSWSPSLAAEAQAWTDSCHYAHQSGPSWGENIAAGTGYSSNSQANTAFFNLWVSEEQYNTDGTFSCCSMADASCCHLTQVVWAATTEVGCGLTLCPTLTTSSGSMTNAAYLACYYNPAGNNPTYECTFDWSPFKTA